MSEREAKLKLALTLFPEKPHCDMHLRYGVACEDCKDALLASASRIARSIQATYGLQDLPGGDTGEIKLNLIDGRPAVLSIRGSTPHQAARVVVWEDAGVLRAACLDIDARPLKRRKR